MPWIRLWTPSCRRDLIPSHDEASKIFISNKIHHAVVVDDEGTFVGVISAWDVAREGYLDAKAWPWNRQALG